MIEVLKSLLSYFRSNWPEVVWIVIAASAASYLATRRAKIRWRKREFMNRLNVSLTSIADGKLTIRTILEKDCEEVFLNTAAAKEIIKLAKQTSEDNPIIPIPQDDCWQYLNALLNEISERFAAGHLKLDMGLNVTVAEYLLCLTCERAGPVRTRKIRGMLVRKALLENLPEEEPSYERSNHHTRWETLQKMALEYKQNPYRFITISLGFSA